MASSGSFNTNAYSASDGTRYLTFAWNIQSQSIETNTTTISWTLKGGGTSGQYIYSGNFGVVIDGVWKYSTGKWDRIKLYNGTTIASGTHTFTHEADGTKSFSVYIQGGVYNYDVNCTGSKTFDLDIIARASQPSCVTYPEHTQNVGEFGDEISIHMNRKNSEFTHTVRYAYGDLTGTIATNVTNGVKWTIPLSFMDLIPAATSGSGTIYVDTYHGSTLVGTKYCGFTATVPASVKPSCTFTLEDVTGVDDIYGSPAKGLSKIKVTVSAKTAYSSPIASYKITANGVNYSGSVITTGVLTAAGTSRVTATVTDKRGRSGSVSYDMTVQDYTPPAITAMSAARCNADGTANKRGEYVKVTFSAVVSAMNNKNTAAYSLKYKKTSEGESAYTTVAISNLANNYAPTKITHIFAASAGSSYDVIVLAVDRHNSSNPATKSTKAPTAAAIFSWRGFLNSSTKQKEEGAGIGKVPEKPNVLQVGWEAEFEQSVSHQGNVYSFQPESFSGEKGYTALAEIKLNTLNVNAPIVFKINRRGALCPMTVYVLFASSSSTTDPDLDSITYEGDNYGAFLVKKATSTWRLYVDNISGWSNPCLQEWYTTDNQCARLSVSFPNEQIAGTEPNVLGTYHRATPAKMQSLVDFLYPVGSIYFSYSHVSPASLFGGTWTRIENAFLWATTSGGTIGQTGGEAENTLGINHIPSHNHHLIRPQWYMMDGSTSATTYNNNAGSIFGYTGSTTRMYKSFLEDTADVPAPITKTGGGEAHNNMPPYIQVSAWRRTA